VANQGGFFFETTLSAEIHPGLGNRSPSRSWFFKKGKSHPCPIVFSVQKKGYSAIVTTNSYKEITRKNVISIVFQNSKSKTCSCSKNYKTRDAPGASPRHYGTPVAMALYNQGSGIPVQPMNRRSPRPKKGAGLAHGGEFNTTRNQSPEYDYTKKKHPW